MVDDPEIKIVPITAPARKMCDWLDDVTFAVPVKLEGAKKDDADRTP